MDTTPNTPTDGPPPTASAPAPASPKPSGMSGTRLVVLVVLGVGLAAAAFFGADRLADMFSEKEAPPPPVLQAGGTSVVQFMVDQWGFNYPKKEELTLRYASTGSTEGVNSVIDRKFAIGFAHGSLTDEQKKKARDQGGELVQVPVVLCGVVPVYHIKGLKRVGQKEPGPTETPPPPPVLNFTADLLARIFLGDIKEWDHEDIKAANPGVEFPKGAAIKSVHRQDSSGTTQIFTEYLLAASPFWKEKVGKAGSTIDWKAGEGRDRNNGAATAVEETDLTIGYVDLLFAKARGLAYGAVQNAAGKNVRAEPEGLTAATAELVKDIPDDLAFKLTNRPGDTAYPITGAVWAVFYQTQPAAEYQRISDFLQWVVHDGQKIANKRQYAALPAQLVEKVDQKLKLLKSQ